MRESPCSCEQEDLRGVKRVTLYIYEDFVFILFAVISLIMQASCQMLSCMIMMINQVVVRDRAEAGI